MPQDDTKTNKYLHLIVALSFAALYLLLTTVVVGVRPDHYKFLAVVVVGLIAHRYTRMLTYGLTFFILFWIIYDTMRAFPNYQYNEVSTLGVYHLEKQLFGIGGLTPNEFLGQHSSPFLNFMTGFFYLCWVPVPIGLAIYLLFKDKYELLRYSFVFLFVNLLGFTIYYLFPAAPPWYVEQYGAKLVPETMGSAARLLEFDKIVGSPIFENMYTKNANVFAAVPSLHAAYPLIASYFSVKNKLKFFSILSICVTLGIWFSAIYSNHHYLIDVLLGIGTAVVGLKIWNSWIQSSTFDVVLKKYSEFINTV